MQILHKLFGEDNSSQFISLLPQKPFKALVLNSIKILIYPTLLLSAIFLIFILATFGEDQKYKDLIDLVVLLGEIIIFPFSFFLVIKYFYDKDFSKFKRQLTSLGFITVVKHTLILSVLLTFVSGLIYGLGLLIVPSNIQQWGPGYIDTIKNSPHPILGLMLPANQLGLTTPKFYLVTIPLALLVIAVYEELMFRVILFRVLRNKLGLILAVIISSLAFTLMHPLVFGSIFIFLFAVILSIYYQYKNNILVPMIIHGLADLFLIQTGSIIATIIVLKILGI